MSEIKVSVLMTTYNHEKFIAQALDGALMQKTNFDYEIVVGEDCSTDNTRDILIEYKEKYPDKIKLLLHEQNLGLQGKYNFVQTLKVCQGQYIAMLEGDDYWTSPHKLQTQIDFLDSHPDFSICSHNVYIKYEGQNKPMVEWLGSEHKEIMTIEDLLGDGSGGATCSLVFRNKVFGEFPDWFFKVRGGDWLLQILCASKGKMKYFTDVMGVYRKHPGGVSAVKPGSQADIDMFDLDGVVKCELLNKHFEYRYDRYIRKTLARYHYPNLVCAHVRNWRRNVDEAKKYARKIVKEDHSIYRITMRRRVKFVIFIVISDILILLNRIIKRLL